MGIKISAPTGIAARDARIVKAGFAIKCPSACNRVIKATHTRRPKPSQKIKHIAGVKPVNKAMMATRAISPAAIALLGIDNPAQRPFRFRISRPDAVQGKGRPQAGIMNFSIIMGEIGEIPVPPKVPFDEICRPDQGGSSGVTPPLQMLSMTKLVTIALL